ncbi:cellulase family glycosylhydrolase [Clostridium sp.]|uniref:cellulase family glycosylhydrolase n=1 Tax=Clostridium sp. TaxID=1506 RepID=UPI00284B5A2A|nr:cellulase family glycosylhydrolase [Clostridium sp.]MDR3597604.1 cellulase family glycosylhydrolase [Clostridium sp.]
MNNKQYIYQSALAKMLVVAIILTYIAIFPTVKTEAAINNTTQTEKTAIEVTQEMGYGWNLGNTMEATASWLPADATAYDYEKAWGMPTTTKAMIDGLKASGINSVRIPVAWSNLMSKDGKYTISQSYFDRVDQIISYVLDNNMYAIINDHWDGGWWSNFGSNDEAVRNETMNKYKTMWTQIVNHYANYSDHLIFESANEELGDAFGTGLTLDQRYAKVNEINQAFVDIVRGSGGNNKIRYLLIAGYNTDIDSTCDNRFVMPTDVIQNHLIVSVHYYTPPAFCIADETNNSWGYSDSWGTDSDRNYMKSQFEEMQKFTKAGYGVIFGEYGVARRKADETIKTGTADFFKSVVSLAKEYNYCAMLWDTNGWYDRQDCAFKDQDIASVYKSTVSVTSVTLDSKSLNIAKGDTSTLTATVLPSDATNKNVTWESSNAAIAIVDANGKVTGVSKGTAVITATTVDGGKIAECTVTVTDTDNAESIILNKASDTLTVGETDVLIATINSSSTTGAAVTWESDNSNIVSVDKNGVITGVSAGEARITATSVVDTSKHEIAIITVTAPENANSLTITKQPSSQTVIKGKTASFSIEATGSGLLTYQWQKDSRDLNDGGDISGANDGTITIKNVEKSDEGEYLCIVTDEIGNVTTSSAVKLYVNSNSSSNGSSSGGGGGSGGSSGASTNSSTTSNDNGITISNNGVPKIPYTRPVVIANITKEEAKAIEINLITNVSTVLGEGAIAKQTKELVASDGNKLSITSITKNDKNIGEIITAEGSSLATIIPIDKEDGKAAVIYKYMPLLDKYIKLSDGVTIGANTIILPTQANATYIVSTSEIPATEIITQGWAKVDTNWYMVNATGDPQVGWQKDSIGWVYLSLTNGVMKTGWILDGGNWYYLRNNGYMATGWIKDGETWYYCNADGSMITNTTIDGYQLGSNGAWIG